MKITNKHFIDAYKFIGTGVAFYIFGQLAMPLTVPPSYAGAIWPPAGIALAAVLLWGNRVLPGIFLAELLINYETYNASLYTESLVSLFWFCFQAFNSVFRAWLGCWLIKKFVGFPNALIAVNSIFSFFILAAIVSTSLPACLSIFSLLIRGEITSSDFGLSFIIWWMGDAIGVAIFTPLVFILFAQPKNIWQRRKFSVGIPLIVTLSLAVAACLLAQKMEELRLKGSCQKQIGEIANALDNEFQEHVEQLYSVTSFVNTDEEITANEFKEFTSRIMQGNQDIHVLEWIEKVSESASKEVPDFIAKYAEYHGNDNEKQTFNPLMDPEIYQSLVTSRIADKPILTKVSTLTSSAKKLPGFRIYLPIFSPMQSHAINGETHNLKGFIAEEIDINAYVTESLKRTNLQDVVVRIWENHFTSKMKIIYESANSSGLSDPLDLTVRFPMQMGGQTWMLEMLPDENYLGENYSWYVWAVLASGMLFTSFMSIGLLVLTGQSATVRKEVEKRTEELRETNNKLAASEAQFRELVQSQSAIVWRADPRTFQYTFVSNEAETLGYPLEQWIEEKNFWFNTLHEDDKPWAAEYCRTQLKQCKSHDLEYRMIAADGRVVWLRNIINLRVEQGEIKELLGFTTDITEQKSSEEQLRLAATTFESLQGIIIMDKDGKILRVNKAFSDITGYSDAEVMGRTTGFLQSGRVDDDFNRKIWEELSTKGKFEGEVINQTKDGRIHPEWQTITAVKNGQGITTHYVAVFSDITEKKEAECQINNLAFYDSLTSLPNRRLLQDRLQQEIAVSKRHSRYGAIIFLDLDRFKVLNDSLGHHIGDELLIQVAYRLVSVLRDEDTAARLGGDEFVVLVHGNAKIISDAAEQALTIAEKIKAALNETYYLKGYEHHFTPSIGITLFPEKNYNPDAIIQEADTAMYRSKARGRNTISFFHPSMQEAADARLSLEKELRVSMKNGDFYLCYQPQVDCTGRVISAEALIRWAHPERGVVLPEEFIPIAEETHLVISIGSWVIKETCKQIKKWKDSGIELEKVAVNVSSRQFRQTNFVGQIRKAIEEFDISSGKLEIELTESVLIDDIEDSINKMQILKELGVSISIDDFGTGYSSLAYLKKLPIDSLKIDQNFVRDILSDSNDAVIVETIIDMAKHLGLGVVAEGVESQQQFDFLTEKGCLLFQGYYFNQPMRADEFVRAYFQ